MELKGVATFRADAVYSRTELAKMLEGIMDVHLFLERLAVPVRFKNAVLGADVLKALQDPPRESLLSDEKPGPSVVEYQPLRRSRKSSAPAGLKPISMDELKRRH